MNAPNDKIATLCREQADKAQASSDSIQDFCHQLGAVPADSITPIAFANLRNEASAVLQAMRGVLECQALMFIMAEQLLGELAAIQKTDQTN